MTLLEQIESDLEESNKRIEEIKRSLLKHDERIQELEIAIETLK